MLERGRTLPNGGSDCCGTCWFNAKNKGEAGYGHASERQPAYCTIRKLPIEDDFYTYCGNHPHRRPDRDPVPIGPVFIDKGNGRQVWSPSPDTEEVRLHLLDLLANIQQEAAEEYPIGLYSDELVVWQLGEFRESRAVADLQRISASSPRPSYGKPQRTRSTLVSAARESLTKIEPSKTSKSPAPTPKRMWWQFWE